jgi:acetolactate synthase-1/2/3 large subunit
MGFALPSVVGAYYAGNERRVIMLEGDGSLQLNIQEFETIVSNGINAKMFIFNNIGYAAITTMQDRNFDGFYVGSNEKSGLFMPDMKKISEAYGIPYRCIEQNAEIDEVVIWAMNEVSGACIVDIKGSLSFDEIPKCISSVDEKTGQRVSAVLENPFPFLSDSEMQEIERFMVED